MVTSTLSQGLWLGLAAPTCMLGGRPGIPTNSSTWRIYRRFSQESHRTHQHRRVKAPSYRRSPAGQAPDSTCPLPDEGTMSAGGNPRPDEPGEPQTRRIAEYRTVEGTRESQNGSQKQRIDTGWVSSPDENWTLSGRGSAKEELAQETLSRGEEQAQKKASHKDAKAQEKNKRLGMELANDDRHGTTDNMHPRLRISRRAPKGPTQPGHACFNLFGVGIVKNGVIGGWIGKMCRLLPESC